MSDKYTAITSRHILSQIKKGYPDIQVISGNGIFDYEEAKLRFELGADAISFGAVYLF